MSNPHTPHNLPQLVRTLQIIWFALTFGSATMLVVFWYLREEAKVKIPWEPGVPIALILAGIGLLVTVLAFVVPDTLATQANPGRHMTFSTYQAARIMQGAMLEASILMQGVAYLLEGGWWSLALGAALALLLFGAVPTRDAATRWLQRHQH